MNDAQLKEQLLATCPVLPGQEARAWSALQARWAAPASSSFGWHFSRPARLMAGGALALVAAVAIFNLGLIMRPVHHGLAFADSQVPGIYATSFYSHSAQAQVVWLNGMDPVTDKLTYLDPTTVIKSTADISDRPADKDTDRL